MDVVYPEGLPRIARIRPPLTSFALYFALLTMLLILIGRVLNLLPEGGNS